MGRLIFEFIIIIIQNNLAQDFQQHNSQKYCQIFASFVRRSSQSVGFKKLVTLQAFNNFNIIKRKHIGLMNFKSSLASVGKSSQASGSQGNFNTASFGVSSQVNNVFSTNNKNTNSPTFNPISNSNAFSSQSKNNLGNNFFGSQAKNNLGFESNKTSGTQNINSKGVIRSAMKFDYEIGDKRIPSGSISQVVIQPPANMFSCMDNPNYERQFEVSPKIMHN